MKILLVRPNYKSHIITPPIGLGYLASYLNQHGVEARIIDALAADLTTEEVVAKAAEEEPDAVGITCLTAFYEEAVRLSRRLKESGIRVIMGGVHPTFLPYETLEDSQADYVIRGEGEIALLKLAQNNFRQDSIQGVYCSEDIYSGRAPDVKAERSENLDELPFPDWEQIDPNLYAVAPHGALVKKFPVGVITTTRGCPYGCTFCASPRFYDRSIRFRSPENVVEEIKYLVERFGVKEIHFEDDNLTLRRSHIEKICNLIIESGIRIAWACPNGVRADAVDADLMRLMKKSGCYWISFGVESASPEILEKIGKSETLETIANSIELASKAGMCCQGFFVFGLPGETHSTLEETTRFAVKSKLDRAQFVLLDMLPGSQLWEDLQGQFVPNWGKNSYKESEWVPPGLTPEELMEAQTKAFRKFYLRPRRMLQVAMSIKPRQLKFIYQRFKEYRIFSLKGKAQPTA